MSVISKFANFALTAQKSTSDMVIKIIYCIGVFGKFSAVWEFELLYREAATKTGKTRMKLHFFGMTGFETYLATFSCGC